MIGRPAERTHPCNMPNTTTCGRGCRCQGTHAALYFALFLFPSACCYKLCIRGEYLLQRSGCKSNTRLYCVHRERHGVSDSFRGGGGEPVSYVAVFKT